MYIHPGVRADLGEGEGPVCVRERNGTILCYTILYYTMLYSTMIYYTILYYTKLNYAILYFTIRYYTIGRRHAPVRQGQARELEGIVMLSSCHYC